MNDSENIFDGGMWIFALLVLLLLGNGGGGLFGNGNRVGEAYATQADVQRAVDLNSIQQGQANLAADIQRTNYEQIAVTKDAAYNNLGEIRDVQAAVATGFAAQQTCCCETNRNIDSVRYDAAMNTQKVLDAMSAYRMQDMQSQINALQLAAATCGIPRVSPNAWGVYPYAAPGPFVPGPGPYGPGPL